jgi:hypothetical protein
MGFSQEALGRKLGLGEKWRNYPNWESGRAPFPKTIREKLTKMGYSGPFEEPEQAATTDGFVSREEFAETKGSLQTEIRLLREVVEKLGEAVRTLSLRGP